MPSTWIMRAGDAGTGGARSSHALDLLGKNLDDDTDLAGPTLRIAVLAQVLLGERVDVIVGALLRHLDDPSPDLEVAVGVVRILHRRRDLRIARKVLVLHPPPGSVEPDVRAIVIPQTGVTCGVPSRPTVATWANAFFANRSR